MKMSQSWKCRKITNCDEKNDNEKDLNVRKSGFTFFKIINLLFLRVK